MLNTTTLARAASLMREAQDELMRGGHSMIAAHLGTALGLADKMLGQEDEAERPATAPRILTA